MATHPVAHTSCPPGCQHRWWHRCVLAVSPPALPGKVGLGGGTRATVWWHPAFPKPKGRAAGWAPPSYCPPRGMRFWGALFPGLVKLLAPWPVPGSSLVVLPGMEEACCAPPLRPPMARSRDNGQRLPKRLKTRPKALPSHGTLAQPPRHKGGHPAHASSTVSITPIHGRGCTGGGTLWWHVAARVTPASPCGGVPAVSSPAGVARGIHADPAGRAGPSPLLLAWEKPSIRLAVVLRGGVAPGGTPAAPSSLNGS